ncbi:MAG: hypothetical protein WCV50_03500 [Patescibacteria group bacterium]|jgi:hypothetical protein
MAFVSTVLLLASAGYPNDSTNTLAKQDTSINLGQVVAPAQTPVVEDSTLIATRRLLAQGGGYLDLFGKVMEDEKGGAEFGGSYRLISKRMRELAKTLGMPQDEFIEYVRRGITEAMNDINSHDVQLVTRKLSQYEDAGINILVRHSIVRSDSAKTVH